LYIHSKAPLGANINDLTSRTQRYVQRYLTTYNNKPNPVCAQEHTTDNPHNIMCTLPQLMLIRTCSFYHDFFSIRSLETIF